MSETIFTRFKIAGYPAADWAAANPVLLEREPGLETDTQLVKYGDGVTAWNDLPYTVGGEAGVPLTFETPAAAYFGQNLYRSVQSFDLSTGVRLDVDGLIWVTTEANLFGLWVGDGVKAIYTRKAAGSPDAELGRYSGGDAGLVAPLTVGAFEGPNRWGLSAIAHAGGSRAVARQEGRTIPATSFGATGNFINTAPVRVYVATDDIARCRLRARRFAL